MVDQKPGPPDKMKVVVDTNIIFSVLLNSNGSIGDVFFNSGKHFEFYSFSYMRLEIQKHGKRLRAISKLPEKDLHLAYSLVLFKI